MAAALTANVVRTNKPTVTAVHVPLVHLNGTSQDELVAQLTHATNVLATALVALHAAEPHGRDYYPMGDDAYAHARDEHVQRVNRLVDVRDELMAIAYAVAAQDRNRNR